MCLCGEDIGVNSTRVPLAIKTIIILFKVSQLDLMSLKRNNVRILNNKIIAKLSYISLSFDL